MKMTLENALNYVTGIYCTEDSFQTLLEARDIEIKGGDASDHYPDFSLCELYENVFYGFEDLIPHMEREAEYLNNQFKE